MLPTATPFSGARRLIAAMVLVTVAIGALAYWDAKRESASALEDFAEGQAALAAAVATDLSHRLEGTSGLGSLPPALFTGAAHIERPNAVAVFLLPPGEHQLVATDGRRFSDDPLSSALEAGQSTYRVPAEEAPRLSLPARTAMAGLARINAGGLGRWGIAVVASANRERDREAHARWRLILALALAGGLVLTFGSVALRKQHTHLLLERELAIAAVQHDRDERLGRLANAATMLTFASAMAHELSTPLGVIVGRAEQLLSRVEGDERATRSVHTVLEQSERISQTLRSFLDLARGQAPARDRVDPAAVMTAAMGLVEHRFAKAGVHLEPQLTQALPAIQGDGRLLEHALVNLLLNACDACPVGGSVRVGASADAGGLTFWVSDNGSGIDSAHLAQIAEPFFTTKPRGQGTGLGLALTKEIVKSHRGSLSIVPELPRGTRASFQIPIAEVPHGVA